MCAYIQTRQSSPTEDQQVETHPVQEIPTQPALQDHAQESLAQAN